MFQNSGKAKAEFSIQPENPFKMGLMIENGEYLDDGYMYTVFDLKEEENKTKLSIVK